MVFRTAEEAHDTHIHPRGKSYHHSPIVAYGTFPEDGSDPKGVRMLKMSWTSTAMGGHNISLQFSILFSQASVIEHEELENLPRVEIKSQNEFIFLVIYEQRKSQLGAHERTRRWFYAFLCLCKTQSLFVWTCMYVCVRVGSCSVTVISLVKYGRVSKDALVGL